MKVEPLNFRREDISDLSKGEDIERLFRGLNSFGSSAGQAFKALTFTDNLLAFVKEIDFDMGKESTSPALTAPWALYAGEAAVDVWKSDAAIVQLEGRLAPTGAANPSACMTLPKEFWPHRNLYFSVDSAALLSATANVASATGVVTIGWAGAAPAWVSLAGIIYTAFDHRALPNPQFPITFTNELSGKAKPVGCWVWQAWDMTDQRKAPVTAGPVAWELSSKGDQIVVRDIANLAHERKYKVRLVVVGG